MTDSRESLDLGRAGGIVRLVLRARVTVREGEATQTQLTVHCPIRGGAQALEHCRGCSRLERETPSALTCRVPASEPSGAVGELIAQRSVLLDGEVDVDTAARELRREGATAAAVVDDVGVVVGQVQLEALDHARVEQAERRAFERVAPAEVEDVMQVQAPTMIETGSIREAARLMVQHRALAVSVVDAAGRSVGTVEIFDVLRAVISDGVTP